MGKSGRIWQRWFRACGGMVRIDWPSRLVRLEIEFERKHKPRRGDGPGLGVSVVLDHGVSLGQYWAIGIALELLELNFWILRFCY